MIEQKRYQRLTNTKLYAILLAKDKNGGVEMVRPTKCRKVGYIPECLVFKPAGIEMDSLEQIILNIY